jgi:hypothetical protein
MRFSRERPLSRRSLCLCCVGGAAYAATGGWLTPREAFAEARGLVSMFKDHAAVALIATHKLRNNISVLEGSGGNIAVLTGPDGKGSSMAASVRRVPNSPKLWRTSAPIPSHTWSTRIGISIIPLATNGCMPQAQRLSPKRTPASICQKFSALTTGTIISFPCNRAGFPARCLQPNTA